MGLNVNISFRLCTNYSYFLSWQKFTELKELQKLGFPSNKSIAKGILFRYLLKCNNNSTLEYNNNLKNLILELEAEDKLNLEHFNLEFYEESLKISCQDETYKFLTSYIDDPIFMKYLLLTIFKVLLQHYYQRSEKQPYNFRYIIDINKNFYIEILRVDWETKYKLDLLELNAIVNKYKKLCPGMELLLETFIC